MNRFFTILCTLLAVISLYGSAGAQSKASAFTGFWVWDKAKTNTSKDFPERLKDYKMLVSEDKDNLMVKSQVDGPVEVRVKGDVSNGSGGITSGSRSTATNQNGTMATSTAASNGPDSSGLTKTNYGGTMALYFTPPETTYDLTGKEIKIEPNPGDKVNGTTRIKAKSGKDGKSMEFTIFRIMRTPRGEVEIVTREYWTIADDGQSMKFRKSVESPTYRDEITLVLAKKAVS